MAHFPVVRQLRLM